MALLNISAAARAVGKNRITLHRYLKEGRLNALIDNDGHTKIDTSELIRVFGELRNTDATLGDATENEDIALLKKMLEEAQRREEWLKTQLEEAQNKLDREHERNMEMMMRLLPLPEGETTKKGWLDKLLGR